MDNETAYHIGASLKDLGRKWFAFSKIELYVNEFIENLNFDRCIQVINEIVGI